MELSKNPKPRFQLPDPSLVDSYFRKKIFLRLLIKFLTRTTVYLHRKSFNSETSLSFLLKQLTVDVIPIKTVRP